MDEELLPPAFVAETAVKTGRGKSTVREDIQIAENIPARIKEIIYDTPLENRKTLRVERPKQKAIATLDSSVAISESGEPDVSSGLLTKIVRIEPESQQSAFALIDRDR